VRHLLFTDRRHDGISLRTGTRKDLGKKEPALRSLGSGCGRRSAQVAQGTPRGGQQMKVMTLKVGTPELGIGQRFLSQ
jgi:hypothetical protein